MVVAVGLDRLGETTTRVLDGTGRLRTNVFWVLEDDETLAVGETTTLRVRVRSAGSTLASTNRTVTIEEGSRSYECEGSSDVSSGWATSAGPRSANRLRVAVPGRR